jgi:hypothetical protein
MPIGSDLIRGLPYGFGFEISGIRAPRFLPQLSFIALSSQLPIQ